MSVAPSIHHILVAHDFSETAEHGLDCALLLARRLGARITVIHIYDVPFYGYPDALVESVQFVTDIERAASRKLESIKARMGDAGVEAGVLLRRGSPWRKIAEAARETKADLVVVGAHRRRGVAGALLGGVADKIIRTAPCPVLTVHLPEGEPAKAPEQPTASVTAAREIRRVLVAHDFSDTAEHALAYALSLAKKFDARLTVLHVYEVPTLGYSEALVVSFEFSSEIERIARKALSEIAARARQAGVEVDVMLRRGNAWTEVTAVAEETQADLIVIGTHGRRNVSRLLLGSVAEKVVRAAPCPVVTVHLPETPGSVPLNGDAEA